MNFLITESQLKFIVENKDSDFFTVYLENLSKLSNEVYETSKKKFGIDLKLLVTWGAGVGGFIAPLDNFIKNGNFNISDSDGTLIIVAVISTLFLDNESKIKRIQNEIEKNGLSEIFDLTLNKAETLKESFINFLSSMNVSVNNVISLARYSFLIPIIDDLQNLAQGTSELKQAAIIISKRLLSSGLLTISSEILTKLIHKILLRFK